MTIENKQHTNVCLRATTRTKWDRIAAARRWSLAETADALADYYIDGHQEGLSVFDTITLTKPPTPQPNAGDD